MHEAVSYSWGALFGTVVLCNSALVRLLKKPILKAWFAITIVVWLVLGPLVANAADSEIAPEQPGAFVKTSSGCSIWVGRPQASLLVKWSGACEGGRASGTGTLDVTTTDATEHYEGTMSGGMMNGAGSYLLGNNSLITGYWRHGVLSGNVKFRRYDGFQYEGGWANGQPDGWGVATWRTGARYEGLWKDGTECGRGTMIYPSGAKYAGDYDHGIRSGHGTLSFPDGSLTEGDWKNDRAEGHVKTISRTGDIFEGNFVDLRREGMGSFKWHNGDQYYGEWHRHLPEGEGTLTRADGTTVTGEWHAGCLSHGDETVALFVKPDICHSIK